MKHTVFFLTILCLAVSARGQIAQRTDTTPQPPSLWVVANSPSHSAVSLAFLSPDTCWGMSADSGMLISSDGGMHWQVHQPEPFNGDAFFRTKHEGWLRSGPSLKQLAKTTDAGATWQVYPEPMQAISGFAFLDSVNIILAGGFQIARSSDAGQTWDVQDLTFGGNAIGFANPQVGYILGDAHADSGARSETSCYKTVDSGKTWSYINTHFIAAIPVYGLAVIDPLTIVAISSDSIYRTTNGGAHWVTIPGISLDFTGIAMKGKDGYITGGATLGGVFTGVILHTEDSGQTWNFESTGVNVGLYSPVIYDDSLAACSGDSGLIMIRTTSQAGVETPRKDSLSLIAFPNPGQDLVTIQYTLPTPQHVTAILYDMAGHQITNVLNGVLQPADLQSVPINTANLANGSYFIQFSSENYSSTAIFTIQR